MRHELKFKINKLQHRQISALCNRMMNTDIHGENGIYLVKSLYYDTPANKDYNDTMKNAFARHKIRLRTYGTDNEIFRLEQKYKRGNLSSKVSVDLDFDSAVKIADGDYSPLLSNRKNGEALFSIMSGDLYQPKLIVQYKRQAYYLDVDNFRLTLDYDVEYGMPDVFFIGNNPPLISSCSSSVMEIKYDNYMPAWLMSSLKKYGVVLETNSKYCQGMRTLYGI